MSAPQVVIIVDKFGNETELECKTNYSHDKLVGLYQMEVDQPDGCDAHDFYDWAITKGYYLPKKM